MHDDQNCSGEVCGETREYFTKRYEASLRSADHNDVSKRIHVILPVIFMGRVKAAG